MRTLRFVVDNRVFVLGLDQLYHDAMKQHERDELLLCARRVASVLQVQPADVPIGKENGDIQNFPLKNREKKGGGNISAEDR